MVLCLSMQELPHKREAPQDPSCVDDENADEVVSHITMLNVRNFITLLQTIA